MATDLDIRTVRRSMGLTQRELADMLGVARSLVPMWETGQRRPTADQLTALNVLVRGWA